MYSPTFRQMTLVAKCFYTFLTFEILFLRMHNLVGCQITFSAKCFSTFLTFEILFSRMHKLVGCQITFWPNAIPHILHLKFFSPEWTTWCVVNNFCSQMLFHKSHIWNSFPHIVQLGALSNYLFGEMLFHRIHIWNSVLLSVQPDVLSIDIWSQINDKWFSTNLTLEIFFSGMHNLVCCQITSSAEGFFTDLTFEILFSRYFPSLRF